MRRLLNEAAGYLGDLRRATLRGWNAFFFSAADPTSLGLIRIAVGLWPSGACWSSGWTCRTISARRAGPTPARSARSSGRWPGRSGSWCPMGGCGRSGASAWRSWRSLPSGLFSRVTAVLCWVIVVSTVRRVPIALYGFDQVLSTLTLYLAVTGASGQAVSLDRFLRRWRQARAAAGRVIKRAGAAGRRVTPDEPGRPVATVSANLALRLIQLHLVVIYGMAGLAKLQGPSWWNGTAIWKTMATGEFVVLDFTALAAWPLARQSGHARQPRPGIALSGAGLGEDRATALAGRHGGAACGDRRDEPWLDRIRPGDDRGKPRFCVGPVAAWAGHGAESAGAQGPLRWCAVRGAGRRWP